MVSESLNFFATRLNHDVSDTWSLDTFDMNIISKHHMMQVTHIDVVIKSIRVRDPSFVAPLSSSCLITKKNLKFELDVNHSVNYF